MHEDISIELADVTVEPEVSKYIAPALLPSPGAEQEVKLHDEITIDPILFMLRPSRDTAAPVPESELTEQRLKLHSEISIEP